MIMAENWYRIVREYPDLVQYVEPGNSAEKVPMCCFLPKRHSGLYALFLLTILLSCSSQEDHGGEQSGPG